MPAPLAAAAAVAGKRVLLRLIPIALPVVAAIVAYMVMLTVMVATGAGATAKGGGPVAGCLPPGASNGGGAQGPVDVRAQQIANAKAIVAAVKEAGMPGYAAQIAIIAAVGESDLINVARGDAAGPDSRGLFQQRRPWGTEAQRMDPRWATLSFLLGPKHDGVDRGPGGRGLASIAGWPDMQPSAAIHAVQINADPNHYTNYIGRAEQIATEAGISFDFSGDPYPKSSATPSASSSTTTTGPTCGGAANVTVGTGPCPLDDKSNELALATMRDCNAALQFMADQVTSGSKDWYRRCLALVEAAYGWPANGVPTAEAQGEIMRRRGLLSTDRSNIPRGAVLFWSGGSAGHAAIYDGQGYIYSNDVPVQDGRVGRVPWDYPETVWGKTFMGWSPPFLVSS